MNKKTILILLNSIFLLLTFNLHYEIEKKRNNLIELESINKQLINTINKNGLMKNCDLLENSTPLINPYIFKNSKINSININIKKDKKYEFCYSEKNNIQLPYISTTSSYNDKIKNDYLFLKKIKVKKDCTNFIKLTNNYFYCIIEDYIIYK